jgi:hypothetical protein
VAKDLTEGRSGMDCFLGGKADSKTSKDLNIGKGRARSRPKEELYPPRSAVTLLVMPFKDSLAASDSFGSRVRSMDSGADFDRSRNANARRSLSNTRRDHSRGEEMNTERQW